MQVKRADHQDRAASQKAFNGKPTHSNVFLQLGKAVLCREGSHAESFKVWHDHALQGLQLILHLLDVFRVNAGLAEELRVGLEQRSHAMGGDLD